MSGIDFSKIDLAFMLDTTSSMGSYINHAKQNITNICDEIIKSEKCSLRVGLVNYRDHPPQDVTYITEVNELTDDISKVKTKLTNTTAYGGGDCPESMCCAFRDCLEKLEWRVDAVKVVILIADAPPHGLGCVGDSMPDGCPLKNDPVEIAHKMAQKGITLYCAGCEPALNSYRQFFIALCLITGGQYVNLDDASNLSNVIVGGTREEISMEKMIAQVHNDLIKEATEKGSRIDEEELTKRVHEILNSKKTLDSINKLKTDIEITDNTKELSKTNTLEEMKKLAKNKHISLINDAFWSKKSHFSKRAFTPFSTTTKIAKKPLIKPVTTRKPKPYTKIAKKPAKKSLKFSSRGLRRSKRIKEIEERKKKLSMLIEDNLEKEKTTKKRKTSEKINDSESESEKENKNKKLCIDRSSSTEIATETVEEEKEFIDIDRARRLAKKVIARNFK